ncbi:MAG: hypothetical protein SGJ20_07855, partial [Planctomycetota bacterium]|nr:hypothetical protein [Planctomycetota bacterium]
MSNLENEVAKFRCWAKQRDPDEGYSGEWECDYPDWYELYAAVEELLAAERTLTDSEVDLILYV